jgi:hypothetical protein
MRQVFEHEAAWFIERFYMSCCRLDCDVTRDAKPSMSWLMARMAEHRFACGS